MTIPLWQETKNTIAYHWNSSANTKYNIAGSTTETVSLQAPEGAKSFTIQRSAGTGTRISQVCFQLSGSTPSETEALHTIQKPSAAHKVLRIFSFYILNRSSTPHNCDKCKDLKIK